MDATNTIKDRVASGYARWLKRLLWALAALLLLWALLWAALPGIVKRQAEGRGSELLGRKVTIGSIDFQPWSLELTVRDIALATADGTGTQLSIARIYVDAEMQSLLRLAPVFDAVQIESPKVQLTHLGGGHYDIDDVIARLAPKPDDPPSAPPRFALYNMVLSGGEVDFTDRLNGRDQRHALRKLHLSVPFLSNLGALRDVLVHPRLAFEFNGSGFDSAAEGTPFAQTRKGEATLAIRQLDIAPYLAYLPASLPVKPRAAVVDTDLKLSFVQAAQAQVKVSGTLKVAGVDVADAAGKDLLKLAGLDVVVEEIRPLEQQVALSSVVVDSLELQVRRAANGRLNLDMASNKASDKAAPASKKPDAKANAQAADASTDAAGTATPTATPAAPWKLQLASLTVKDSTVRWNDDAVTPAARLAAQAVQLQVRNVHWPLSGEGIEATPVQVQGALDLVAGAARAGSDTKSKGGKSAPAHLQWEGEGTDLVAQLQASLDRLDLTAVAPYMAPYLVPQLSGMVHAKASLQWKDRQLAVVVQKLGVDGLALGEAGGAAATTQDAQRVQREWPSVKSLEVSDVQLKLAERSVSIGKVLVKHPQLRVRREADGQWMFAQWLRGAATSEAAGSSTSTSTASAASDTAPPAPAWRVSLADLQVDDATIGFVDRTPSRPVFLEAGGLRLRARNLNADGVKPAPIELEATVRTARTDPGSLKFKGSVAWAPVVAQGTVDMVDFPVHAAAPYFADGLRLQIQRAEANYHGTVRYAALPAGPDVTLQGDVALDDVRVVSVVAPTTAAGGPAEGEELLNWKSLSVPGLEFGMQPGQAMRVRLREVSLADFFARLIINPEGRLLLQDLVTRDNPGATTGKDTASTSSTASATAPASVATAAPAADSAASAAGLAPIIDVGPIRLVNGRVAFSDRFIKPNYSAMLTELNGRLSRFSSQPVGGAVQMADLELRGRAEGTASLEITGKLNPLAKPLALDVHGRVRDLELSPLSAYSVKYAGYGIERGKLSVDVNYAITPDGQLNATNKLILNQLTFGDKVEGAPASLPVKLAVALLADRNGVIDLDLPISGSLNDPQFSIWPVVWKVIGNLITKALTAPFALFSGGGGADELGNVAFVPGTNVLSPAGRQGLEKVGKTLVDRLALKLTITGAANLEAERVAMQRDRLDAMLLSEKRRAAAAAGKIAADVTSVSAEEYPALLKEVYRRSDIKKPRNLVGFTKDLPVPDMEALLMASIVVNEDSMRELATARGVAVRDFLNTQKVPTERLFLGAGKTSGLPAGWKPSADLNLSSQ